MKKLEFYFDFLSPFSYFAWLRHKQELQEHQIECVYKPVLMGKLFSHHGFPGPGQIVAKRDYELKKCFRYAHQKKIDFHPPARFPFNPLAIIRLATQNATAGQDQQHDIIDFIFKQIWAQGMVLEDPELISSLFTENSLPLEIIENSFARESKQELKQNIKMAIERQVFGVPTFALDNEIFWGNDSFDSLKLYLKGNDIWNKELYNEVLTKNKIQE